MAQQTTLKSKNWRILPVDRTLLGKAIQTFPVSPVMCRILLNRGISSREQALRFLSPTLDNLYDPYLLKDMRHAVNRVCLALERREKIMVHGDYDVDGVTSTALLVRVLRILGADVCWYIPHRQQEGYDITKRSILKAQDDGVTLIITVDCGTSAIDAVAYAQSIGIDVIVTDHHQISPTKSPAFALINPHRPDCSYPFKDLAGVGVTFKFAEAIVRELGYDVSTFRRKFCDLAAIGTVADVVPLLDENRILVKCGIEELPRTGKKGLQALLKTSGLIGKSLSSHSLAFVLGPRLNAAGRLDDASLALELLLANDEKEALRLAQALENCNRERQAEQERITKEALDIINSQIENAAKVLVLSSSGWHPGVIGIVANKLTDMYNRPFVLVALDETSQAGVGSARSIEGFNLFEALVQCEHLLERYGGHARAAGLSISSSKIQEFREAINQIADSALSDSDLEPRLDVDLELSIDQVTSDLAEELTLLEPHGYCNPVPQFVTRNVLVLDKSRLGANGDHIKLKLGTPSGCAIDCMAFGWGSHYDTFRVGSLIDVCYNIRLDRFSRPFRAQMVLCDARPANAVITEPFLKSYTA
jgi:single-stranded-DNA-specific exonuclease